MIIVYSLLSVLLLKTVTEAGDIEADILRGRGDPHEVLKRQAAAADTNFQSTSEG